MGEEPFAALVPVGLVPPEPVPELPCHLGRDVPRSHRPTGGPGGSPRVAAFASPPVPEPPQFPSVRAANPGASRGWRGAGLRAAASHGSWTRRFPRSESGGWIVPGQVSLLLDGSPPASLPQAGCFHCAGRVMLVPMGLTPTGRDQRTERFLPSLGDIGSFALRR